MCFNHHSNQLLRFEMDNRWIWLDFFDRRALIGSCLLDLSLKPLVQRSPTSLIFIWGKWCISLYWSIYLASMLTYKIRAHNLSLKLNYCKICSCCCYLLLLNVSNVLVIVLVAFMTNVEILLLACLVFSAAYLWFLWSFYVANYMNEWNQGANVMLSSVSLPR